MGAAQIATPGLVHAADIGAVIDHRSARYSAAGAGVAHGGEADGALARTAFTDQAQHLAAAQLEADIMHQHIFAGGDAQVAHIQDHITKGAAHARRPCELAWMLSIQSTTKFTPMVISAMAPAG